MRCKKLFAGTLALALLCGSLTGCSFSSVNKTLPEFDENDTIIRSAWWCPEPTAENYEIYKECGLNTVMLVNHNFRQDAEAMAADPVQHTKEGCYYIGTPDGFEGRTMTDKALAMAKEKGLDVILAEGGNYFSWVGEEVNVYEDFTYDYSEYEDIIVGLFSGDEPSADEIPELAESIPYAEKAFPGIPYFANLLPCYADERTALKAQSYYDYLEQYGKNFMEKTSEPRIISVDVYPFIGSNCVKWLFNYEFFTDAAQKYNGDMHMFIQSAVSADGSHRMLNEAEILVQVNTALSYGAEAYSYFLYSPAGEGYPEGLVDREGKPGQMYYHAQKINEQVDCLESAYKHYNYVNTVPLRDGEEDSATSAFNLIQLLPMVGTLEDSTILTEATASNRALVGILRDEDGNEAFYVTNYFDDGDLEIEEDCTFTFTFDGMKKVALYGSNDCLTGEVKDLNKGTFECTLAPGEGMLIIPYRK